MNLPNIVAVVWLAILCVGCDSKVFTDAEMQSQRRFSTIKEGQSYDEVISHMGKPTGQIRRIDASALVYEPLTDGTVAATRLSTSSRDQWPAVIRFLPDRQIEGSVLVFNEGTVTAFVFLSATGAVEHVDVHTS